MFKQWAKGEYLKVQEVACYNVSPADCSHTHSTSLYWCVWEIALCVTSCGAYPQLQEAGDLRLDWRGKEVREGWARAKREWKRVATEEQSSR